MKSFFLSCILCFLSLGLLAQDSDGFVSLFDGESLTGWTSSTDKPESFSVEDGMLAVKGGRAHLYYTGKVNDGDFTNFELKLKVRTSGGSNSGVYFHTEYQKDGWPKVGFEAQVNSTHSDPKKTGSLYGITNIWVPRQVKEPFIARTSKSGEVFILQAKAPSTDGQWFEYHITVKDNHITVKVNGQTTVDWTQPEGWTKDRRIGHGTFALQAHDPTCVVHYRDIKVKVLD